MRYHTEDHMPMFMCLLNWTEQGIRSIKEAPKRAKAAQELAKKVGVEIKEVYLTSGDIEGFLQHDEALLHGVPRTLAVPGRKQHWDRGVALPDRMAKLDAVHSARHQDIGEDEFDVRILAKDLQCFAGAPGLLDHVTE